jgi:DeoR/GlpR family transcriptional regulator of sugar metabolism
MLKSAKQTVMIADYSKFNTWRLAKICDFDDIDIVITDDRITRQDNERLHSLVEEVVVAR